MEKTEFKLQNTKNWEGIHNELFGSEIPQRCQWNDRGEITNVLNIIGTVQSSNHMFLPNGGGLDLLGARRSNEPNCIELLLASSIMVIKPKSLTFEFIGGDLDLNYFYLECEEIQDSGINPNQPDDNCMDEVVELSPLEYVHRSCWDESEYNEESLPKSARLVIRVLKGSIAIFKKTSIYNKIKDTYDGRHLLMGPEQFKQYIELLNMQVNDSDSQ